jgi:hypothetical protein
MHKNIDVFRGEISSIIQSLISKWHNKQFLRGLKAPDFQIKISNIEYSQDFQLSAIE